MSFSAGERLGPYEILTRIGSGGMGEVWKARDTRLGRIVAIKRLKGQHGARFEQEARAIAALNHPHICQIHDVGPDYLVLEYIDGKPLRGPLPPEEAVRLAIQMSGALAEAHRTGIIHRDLKPGNVLVTTEGSAKLLDFGLAKLADTPDSDITKTVEGTVMGTAAYMSPEQASGKPLDERSDIFSFGAVLYEMVSGKRAFGGASTAEVLSAVLRDEPERLTAPAPLTQIVMRCLRKTPAERFQTVAEIKTALESISGKLEEQQPSIAVLPFANMSRDADDEYFSDGLAEEILNVLAHIPGLKVTARTSSFAFRGKEQDITKIAETLRVRTILEGSVRRAGSRIRVTAQLINAADGYHLWSERYDRELTDVFAVQDEIAAAIARALHLKLIGKPATARPHEPNQPAYEALLKGKHQLYKYSPEAFARAKEYFEQAIALDPEYGAPHGALGRLYYQLGTWALRPAKEVMPLAQAEARKALELSPSDPEAHALLCAIAVAYDYDWKEAEKQFRLAMATDSIAPEVRVLRAGYLTVLGRIDDYMREMEAAVEQDPLDADLRAQFSVILVWQERPDRAIVEARKALEIDESAWMAHMAVAGSYAFREMYLEAREPAEKALQIAPWNSLVVGSLAGILSHLGEEQRVRELLAKLTGAAPGGMMMYHLLRSEFDAVAECFEKELEMRLPGGVRISLSPAMKPVRQTARWPKLAKMMNLPETPLI